MSVQDAAVPRVLFVHALLVGLAGIAFGMEMKSSLVCLNPELQERTKKSHFWIFLSLPHALAYCVSIVFFVNALLFFWSTDFFFTMYSHCTSIVVVSIILFAACKFFQYLFFIYRLKFLFEAKDIDELKVEDYQINWLLVALCVYTIGLLATTLPPVIRQAQVIKTIPTGKYFACSRSNSDFPTVLLVAAIWFFIFDVGILCTVSWMFISRILKMENDGEHDDLWGTAVRTVIFFLISGVSAIILGIVVVAFPGDLMWMFVPSLDMFISTVVIQLSLFITFNREGLIVVQNQQFELVYRPLLVPDQSVAQTEMGAVTANSKTS